MNSKRTLTSSLLALGLSASVIAGSGCSTPEVPQAPTEASSSSAQPVAAGPKLAAVQQLGDLEGRRRTREIAESAIWTARELAAGRSAQDVARMGFASIAEIESATAAEAFPMLIVGLDTLAQASSSDPRALLLDRETSLHPLLVDGEVRSAVLVGLREGTLQPVAIGKTNLARKIVALASALRQERHLAADAPLSLIEVPALSIRLLGHDEAGQLILTPLEDVAGFAAGRSAPAAEIFRALQPQAQAALAAAPR